ncbi:MAG: TetR/AcrR family transcriptional regulator [Gaiellaceae bacterium MAG52_C11]|nr:TetR/AcrR family transcriptional regulator [Candidatus Gaiellasilicea maunaloa]
MSSRADARRNRQRLLETATRLFAERGAANVSMDELAAAAGVGKGTIYRSFGDRAGLALALLDESERELQEGLIRGEPPLGPGAPPPERVGAFVRAYVALLEEHVDLIVESQTASAGARYRSGAHGAWRDHLALLARTGGVDDSLLPDLILGTLDGSLYRHLRENRGFPPDLIADAVELVALGVFR